MSHRTLALMSTVVMTAGGASADEDRVGAIVKLEPGQFFLWVEPRRGIWLDAPKAIIDAKRRKTGHSVRANLRKISLEDTQAFAGQICTELGRKAQKIQATTRGKSARIDFVCR